MGDAHNVYSPKQRALLRLWQDGKLRRINLLEGSVRSGKTWISLVLWAFWVASMPADGAFLMVAKTLTSLRRNALDLLQELVGRSNFSYSLSGKQASLFGRRVYLEGVNDARAESKIRGMTLQGAYCDELTLFTEDFFSMLLSRLSLPGAKLIATTNPDSPRHWLMTRYIDRADELDMLVLKFLIDDNPFLDPGYVASLKREYTGFFYDRFILGLWVAAQGRVYQNFDRARHVVALDAVPPLCYCNIGVDYGGTGSATVFCLVGFTPGMREVYVLDEHYDNQNRSAEHVIRDFGLWAARWKEQYPMLREAFCDSAEQLLVKSFRAAAPQIDVRNARKDEIMRRIYLTDILMARGRLFVADQCPHLIEAFENAVWNEKNIQEDERLDDGTSNIDSLDAFEYAIERFYRELLGL